MGKSTHRSRGAAAFGLGLAVWFGWGCAGVLTEVLGPIAELQEPVPVEPVAGQKPDRRRAEGPGPP